MSFLDDLFGGTDDSAQKSQEQSNQWARELFKKNAQRARSDALNILPVSQDNRRAAFQGALDIFGDTIPVQMQQFRRGNTNAQAALLAGLPQIQNAIMGAPVDLSGLQVRSLNPDRSFANVTLPKAKKLNAGPLLGGDPNNSGPKSKEGK